MRRLLVLVVFAAVIVGGVWLALGGPGVGGPTIDAGGSQNAVTRVEAVRDEGVRGGEAGDGNSAREVRAHKLRERAEARAVMLRQISEAEAKRVTKRDEAAGVAQGNAKKQVGEVKEAGEAAPKILDRSGNRAYLTRVMSEQLMPLADECYAMARERRPDLAGMMAIDVELLGDEDIGGVVNEVAVDATNRIDDPELLECVRESLLATTLPPPEQGGRDAFMLSMKFEPDE